MKVIPSSMPSIDTVSSIRLACVELSSRVIPQFRDVILWQRFKTALQDASGQDHHFLLGLLLRDVNATLVLFPGDGLNLHPSSVDAVAAVSGAWVYDKYIEFLVSPASGKMDGDISAALFVRRDAPFVILVLGFKASLELRKVSVADTQTPLCCGRLLHGSHVDVI